MSLELGSRFRLPDGRLVEVVPDTEEILGIDKTVKCGRCAARRISAHACEEVIGCGLKPGSLLMRGGYPRILKEVENEP